MDSFPTLWFWQKSRLSADWFEVYSYTSDECAHPSLTRSPNNPTNHEPWSGSSVDANNHLVVSIYSDHLPNAPAMWYLLVREYRGLMPTQSLLGFASDDYPDGTVIESNEFKRKEFKFSDSICAIKWGFGDPRIWQLFVHDDYRRRRVSTKLINVADLVNIAGNWGGFIYGGDQVTELGKKLGESWSTSKRKLEPAIIFPPL